MSNLFTTQNVRGDLACVRGDAGDTRDRSGVVKVPVLSDGLKDEGGGQERGEHDDDGKVYSTVHTVQNVGDEKAVLRSMNSGQLPRCIDQNQTPDSAREESTIQSQIQTLRGEMLLVGVNLQGGIDTDNSAFCDGHDGTRGMTQNSEQSRRRDYSSI